MRSGLSITCKATPGPRIIASDKCGKNFLPNDRSGLSAKKMLFDQTAQHYFQERIGSMHNFLMESIGPLAEDAEQFRVETLAAIRLHHFHGFRETEGILVRAPRRESIEHIDDREYSGIQRNFAPAQPLHVAAPVEF